MILSFFPIFFVPGAQTGCIAVVCRALLDEKTPAEFFKRDVDEVIETGDNYYKRCMVALKCYKGNHHYPIFYRCSTIDVVQTRYRGQSIFLF